MNVDNLEPFSCDVIINGFWNRAILTPNGIAGKLFGLPPGSGIQVEVAMDGLLPPRVNINGLIVTVQAQRLAVIAETPTYPALEKAKNVARQALEALPETPVSSAGFNVRFRMPPAEESVLHKLEVPLDSTLSDLSFTILSRSLVRGVAFQKGVLNLRCSDEDQDSTLLEFNFHRESKEHKDLTEWLSMSKEVFEPEVKRILTAVLT